MTRWTVEIGDEFEPEFNELHEDVRTEVLALSRVLQQFGPQLGRPRVDTLNGSRHANMKELRFSAADGEWRVAFAFDPKRKAILLALSRSSIETIGSWLVASSQVSAFGHEAAGQLVFAGADLALVESAFDDETRLFARASSRLKKAGFSIPVHLFTGLEGQGLGSGGGHDTAGAFRSEKSRPLGALIQAALQLCSTQLPSRT